MQKAKNIFMSINLTLCPSQEEIHVSSDATLFWVSLSGWMIEQDSNRYIIAVMSIYLS